MTILEVAIKPESPAARPSETRLCAANIPLSAEHVQEKFDPVEVFGKDAAELILNALEQWLAKYRFSDQWVKDVELIIPTLPDGEGFTLKNYYRVALGYEQRKRAEALRHIRRLKSQFDQLFGTKVFVRPQPRGHIDIGELKRRVDIVEVISQHCELRPAGVGKYKARCPFHSEKTPSFIVYPDHFHCYGCQEHGDALTFLQRIKNIDFKTALVELGGMV